MKKRLKMKKGVLGRVGVFSFGVVLLWYVTSAEYNLLKGGVSAEAPSSNEHLVFV